MRYMLYIVYHAGAWKRWVGICPVSRVNVAFCFTTMEGFSSPLPLSLRISGEVKEKNEIFVLSSCE